MAACTVLEHELPAFKGIPRRMRNECFVSAAFDGQTYTVAYKATTLARHTVTTTRIVTVERIQLAREDDYVWMAIHQFVIHG